MTYPNNLPVRCAPSEAQWYVQVIYDLPEGGDCDYSDDYFTGTKPGKIYARKNMIPEGRVILEFEVRRCPTG